MVKSFKRSSRSKRSSKRGGGKLGAWNPEASTFTKFSNNSLTKLRRSGRSIKNRTSNLAKSHKNVEKHINSIKNNLTGLESIKSRTNSLHGSTKKVNKYINNIKKELNGIESIEERTAALTSTHHNTSAANARRAEMNREMEERRMH